MPLAVPQAVGPPASSSWFACRKGVKTVCHKFLGVMNDSIVLIPAGCPLCPCSNCRDSTHRERFESSDDKSLALLRDPMHDLGRAADWLESWVNNDLPPCPLLRVDSFLK